MSVGASAIVAFLAIFSRALRGFHRYMSNSKEGANRKGMVAWRARISAGLGWVQWRRLFVREWVNGYLGEKVKNGGSLVRKTRWVAVVATSFVVNDCACVISEPGIRRSLDERCHQRTVRQS
jgi:hypothetical protein